MGVFSCSEKSTFVHAHIAGHNLEKELETADEPQAADKKDCPLAMERYPIRDTETRTVPKEAITDKLYDSQATWRASC